MCPPCRRASATRPSSRLADQPTVRMSWVAGPGRRLPMPALEPAPPPPAEVARAGPAVKVLLVDDQPANLMALEATLAGMGLDLVKAGSGPEALRYLLRGDFALILLDVKMPGMDGLETAELVRQRQRSQHTPIIFLTAYERDDVQMFKGYSLGAVDYLTK